jgi:Zn-dependent protease
MQLDPQTLVLGLTWYVVFLFSTTLHEAAHAFAAWRLGDPTAYHGGQVTLSPLPHVRREIFGTVVFPILSFALSRGGWMMGWASAPYDPIWAARHPRRAAWMALAGPAANLLLVVVAGLLVRAGMAAGLLLPPEVATFSQVTVAAAGASAGAATALSILFSLNLLLFAFNLLPLPPLDGSGALGLVLPAATAVRFQEFMRQPMVSILGLLVAWRLFGPLFGPLHGLALGLLYPGMVYR